MTTMTKEVLLNEFKGLPVKIRFSTQSRYQKNRYKPEFVEPEAWIYTGKSAHGYCITGEDWKNEEWRNSYFEMIKQEAR